MASGFDSNVSQVRPRTKKTYVKSNAKKSTVSTDKSKVNVKTKTKVDKVKASSGAKEPKDVKKIDIPVKNTLKEEVTTTTQSQPDLESESKQHLSEVSTINEISTFNEDIPRNFEKGEETITHDESNSEIGLNKLDSPVVEPREPFVKRTDQTLTSEKNITEDSRAASRPPLPANIKYHEPKGISGIIITDDTKDNKEKEVPTEDMNAKFLSLKKRLDAFIHRDAAKSSKQSKPQVSADSIKRVIKNYQSQIKHLTQELSTLEKTHENTRQELSKVKQSLQEKSAALEQALNISRERTDFSQEILKEMEVTVFERDRALATVADLKAANKSQEDLLSETYQSLEVKLNELEERKSREHELQQTIEQRDKAMQNLHILMAKRTAERDELLDRLETLTSQIDAIDKSRETLEEIKFLIDEDKSDFVN